MNACQVPDIWIWRSNEQKLVELISQLVATCAHSCSTCRSLPEDSYYAANGIQEPPGDFSANLTRSPRLQRSLTQVDKASVINTTPNSDRLTDQQTARLVYSSFKSSDRLASAREKIGHLDKLISIRTFKSHLNSPLLSSSLLSSLFSPMSIKRADIEMTDD